MHSHHIISGNNQNITEFGFKLNGGSIHTRRTMMYDELYKLLSFIDKPDAKKEDYIKAIYENNCLGKRSGSNRSYSAKYLEELYALDPSLLVFRVLRFFWERDEIGRPLLALLCALTRDPLLRISISYIYSLGENQQIAKNELEKHISDHLPDRYSDNTLSSIGRNVLSTWTKSGHLKGRAKKIRTKAAATPGSVAYALLLSYLTGARGEYLFNTQYTRVLDCSYSELLDLAEEASRRGWIVLKRIGEVIEVQFPSLLTKEELEWVNEQNR